MSEVSLSRFNSTERLDGGNIQRHGVLSHHSIVLLSFRLDSLNSLSGIETFILTFPLDRTRLSPILSQK